MPDAAAYGDAGSDTLGNLSRAVGGLSLPVLGGWGSGTSSPSWACPPVARPGGLLGAHGRALAGQGHHHRPLGDDGRPARGAAARSSRRASRPEVLDPWIAATGVPGVLANRAASGTQIIEELGEEHQRTGKPIVYTSADSVFQVAAHEETVPLETLYAWCREARRILDPLRVARVIARPFVGAAGRLPAHLQPQGLLARGRRARRCSSGSPRRGVPVIGVGKIGDIFDRRGIVRGRAHRGQRRRAATDRGDPRPDGAGFALREPGRLRHALGAPQRRGGLRAGARGDGPGAPAGARRLREGDLLALTADHGCDPTTPSTDHSREYVPLLVKRARAGRACRWARGRASPTWAPRVAEYFGVEPGAGRSFLREVHATRTAERPSRHPR